MGVNLQEDVSNGLPSLHYAVYQNTPEIVFLLLDTGADIESTDPYHNTALDYAMLYENEAMIKLLKSRGAVVPI